MNIDELEKECQEGTGISANKLKTCPETAKFIQCFFAKARKLSTEKPEEKEEKSEKQEKPIIYLDETTDKDVKITKSVKLPNGRVVVSKN